MERMCHAQVDGSCDLCVLQVSRSQAHHAQTGTSSPSERGTPIRRNLFRSPVPHVPDCFRNAHRSLMSVHAFNLHAMVIAYLFASIFFNIFEGSIVELVLSIAGFLGAVGFVPSGVASYRMLRSVWVRQLTASKQDCEPFVAQLNHARARLCLAIVEVVVMAYILAVPPWIFASMGDSSSVGLAHSWIGIGAGCLALVHGMVGKSHRWS
jgi:hypothetical protein